jgi:phenylacetate-CoA ligase
VTPSLVRRAYGSAVLAANFRQKRVPFMPRHKVERIRDQHVRQIVAYAAKSVPFYRELFAREGIDHREIRTAEDLARLPLLDRELVRRQPKLFLSEARPARDSLTFFTAGSTGTPLQVHHDRRSLLVNLAVGERERAPVIDGTGGSFLPKEVYVGNETSTLRTATAFYREGTFMPVGSGRRFVSVRTPIEEVAALARVERPDILVGYGGWIHLFFKTIAARRIEIHPPKMVMYVAEALPHGGREQIEGSLGIPVMSRYSAAEAFKIGFYCEQRKGFHIHEDVTHVRVAGANGATLGPGEVGRLVISNLLNRGTVLLNYPVGDLGSISSEQCPCGRTFKLLSELEGRVEDIMPLPDGRIVHPRAVWQVFQGDPDLLQYQLTQHEPERFELGLVTVDDEAFRRVEQRVRPLLAELLGSGAHIDVERCGEDQQHGEGKFRAVFSLCHLVDRSRGQVRAGGPVRSKSRPVVSRRRSAETPSLSVRDH